jgi:TPP-dependent pyruvate/acetoin dehydrogenase alpha subunit
VDLFEQKLEARGLLSRKQIDEKRAQYTAELAEAAKRVREEPQPAPEAIHDYTFADVNHVGGEH